MTKIEVQLTFAFWEKLIEWLMPSLFVVVGLLVSKADIIL
jgi:hypothetical protein